MPDQAALGDSCGFGRVRSERPNPSCGTKNNGIPELEILTAHALKREGEPGGQVLRLLSRPPLPGFQSDLFLFLGRGMLIKWGPGQGGIWKLVEGGDGEHGKETEK